MQKEKTPLLGAQRSKPKRPARCRDVLTSNWRVVGCVPMELLNIGNAGVSIVLFLNFRRLVHKKTEREQAAFIYEMAPYTSFSFSILPFLSPPCRPWCRVLFSSYGRGSSDWTGKKMGKYFFKQLCTLISYMRVGKLNFHPPPPPPTAFKECTP